MVGPASPCARREPEQEEISKDGRPIRDLGRSAGRGPSGLDGDRERGASQTDGVVSWPASPTGVAEMPSWLPVSAAPSEARGGRVDHLRAVLTLPAIVEGHPQHVQYSLPSAPELPVDRAPLAEVIMQIKLGRPVRATRAPRPAPGGDPWSVGHAADPAQLRSARKNAHSSSHINPRGTTAIPKSSHGSAFTEPMRRAPAKRHPLSLDLRNFGRDESRIMNSLCVLSQQIEGVPLHLR